MLESITTEKEYDEAIYRLKSLQRRFERYSKQDTIKYDKLKTITNEPADLRGRINSCSPTLRREWELRLTNAEKLRQWKHGAEERTSSTEKIKRHKRQLGSDPRVFQNRTRMRKGKLM